MRPRFSVIIPAYNEEFLLPRLLRSVDLARSRFAAGDVETIVADNDSTDRTADVARSMGSEVVTVRKRCIAAARNGGASVASGEVLCFIDADSALHPDTFVRLHEAMLDRSIIAGSTGLTLERVSLGILLVYCLLMPFAILLRIDSGVVFCRVEDFLAVGGYDEELLVSEDVDFLLALRRLGKQSGRKLVRVPEVKALGSTRKFDQHGDWHYFRFFPRILLILLSTGFDARKSQAKAADLTNYWYDPGR